MQEAQVIYWGGRAIPGRDSLLLPSHIRSSSSELQVVVAVSSTEPMKRFNHQLALRNVQVVASWRTGWPHVRKPTSEVKAYLCGPKGWA